MVQCSVVCIWNAFFNTIHVTYSLGSLFCVLPTVLWYLQLEIYTLFVHHCLHYHPPDNTHLILDVCGFWVSSRQYIRTYTHTHTDGFRKVNHPEQGTLAKTHSDEPLEFWHTNFRRGHPELLHLVQRKVCVL